MVQTELVVTKANALVEASYALTLNEQRVILACAAQLDGRKPLPRDNVFVLVANEFQDLFSVDGKNTYSFMEEAARRLFSREIRRIEGKVKKQMRWVYMAEYQKNEGKVKLGFSPEIAPYLTLLHKHFTSYRLAEVLRLTSTYSIRLYEMLMQYQQTGYLVITVEELKERLQLEGKYARFSNLKVRVIEPAVQELTQKTSIDVKLILIKKGRTVVRLEFRFSEKQQLQLGL